MLKVNRINPTSQQKGPFFGTLKMLAFITIVNCNFLNTSITVNHLISKDCLQSTQFYPHAHHDKPFQRGFHPFFLWS